MKSHLPAKYTCHKCNKKSNSKGYYCSFCGTKKEKPDSQFIEYDFDLSPKLTPSITKKAGNSIFYVKKVVISFALILFMGLGFYIPYTVTKNLTQTREPEIFNLDIKEEDKFSIIPFESPLQMQSTTINSGQNAEFTVNDFDIYYEAKDLHNINTYFKNLTPAVLDSIVKIPLDTISSQIDGNISVAVKGSKFILVLKFTNRDYAYTLEKIIVESESEYNTQVLDGYLILSNDQDYLNSNIESYKGSTKNLAKSGYFIDTVNALPSTGQVFIFIKTVNGVKQFEKTLGVNIPSKNLPIGIIIEGDKLNYIDFTF